jgi:hypothetical protein
LPARYRPPRGADSGSMLSAVRVRPPRPAADPPAAGCSSADWPGR